jgi:hypothetical protein
MALLKRYNIMLLLALILSACGGGGGDDSNHGGGDGNTSDGQNVNSGLTGRMDRSFSSTESSHPFVSRFSLVTDHVWWNHFIGNCFR